jgi:hypothetical protein
MAQNMPFANRIVKLIYIYGELFTHNITLTHTHKNFKYFGKNFDFNPKPPGFVGLITRPISSSVNSYQSCKDFTGNLNLKAVCPSDVVSYWLPT